MWVYILGVLIVLSAIVAIQYRIDINKAYKRLNNYDIKTSYSNFGKMTYMDEGTGETILISHGIFGGYDQTCILKSLVGDDFRKIAPSDLAILVPDVPSQPTPENQAKAFLNLLDRRNQRQHILLQPPAVVRQDLCLHIKLPRTC